MSETRYIVHDSPPDLLRFVSLEHEQFLVALANDRLEFQLINLIQGLYNAALSHVHVAKEGDAVIYQLLYFTHYHFLFAASCITRCHLAEAFNSLRSAIDGALVAAQIIHDRPSQNAYFERRPPYDKLIRNLKNGMRRVPPSAPHRLVPALISIHDIYSTFASHADVHVFSHRVRFDKLPGGGTATTHEYFQFAQDKRERQWHFLTLLQAFLVVLEVFSDFLSTEQGKVGADWVDQIQNMGAEIQNKIASLTANRQQVQRA